MRLAAIAAGGTGFLGFILGYGGDEKFYSRVVMPTLHRVTGADPERAHKWAVWAARNRLFPRERHLKSSGMADMDLVSTGQSVESTVIDNMYFILMRFAVVRIITLTTYDCYE